MLNRRILGALLATLIIGLAPAAAAQESEQQTAATEPFTVIAQVVDRQGNDLGQVTLMQYPTTVLIRAELRNMPVGPHGFHLHETGQCEGDFMSAGGHFNPQDSEHGIKNVRGPHVGDLPNLIVTEGSAVTVIEFFNDRLVLAESLMDQDGAAIVVHENPDDYGTDPAGDAGSRIACGVFAAQG